VLNELWDGAEHGRIYACRELIKALTQCHNIRWRERDLLEVSDLLEGRVDCGYGCLYIIYTI